MHRPQARRCVAHTRCLVVVLHTGLGHHLDARSNAVAIALYAAQRNVKPVSWMRTAVHPQFGIHVQTCCHCVNAAVPVEIAEGATAMPPGGRIGEACFGSESLPFSAWRRDCGNTVFGSLTVLPGGTCHTTCPRVVNRSFQPSLSKS
jgi:hypothetical protein